MPKHLSIVWLHIVWSTKNRQKILTKDFRFKLFKHIKENATKNGICLDIINGVEDHIHCLIRLKTTQTVAEVIQLIKGESSHWINKNIIFVEPFQWQEGYGVFSINRDDVMNVRKYIYNQVEHHKEMSYTVELKKLVPRRTQDLP